jgi:hypothetical protein
LRGFDYIMNKLASTIVWTAALSGLFAMLAATASAQTDVESRARARSALLSIQARIDRETNRLERFRSLAELPTVALAADEIELAVKSAKELLVIGEDVNWVGTHDSGRRNEAIHISNTVLGFIELEKGNIAAANDHLLASGRLEGTTPAHLATFGPNMLLAKKLIEKGEKAAPLEYFDRCAKFWQMEDGKLQNWKEAVSKGEVPDFGPNLRYVVEIWRYRN